MELLIACEWKTFKAYMDWRRENCRIRKVSTIESHWKRIVCKYLDVAGHRMNNGTEQEMKNVRPPPSLGASSDFIELTSNRSGSRNSRMKDNLVMKRRARTPSMSKTSLRYYTPTGHNAPRRAMDASVFSLTPYSCFVVQLPAGHRL